VTGAETFDLHVVTPGSALTVTTVIATNLAFGTPSAFANNTVPFNTATPPVAQPQQLTFTPVGATTVRRTHTPNPTFVVGTQTLAIVAPPASGTTTLRSIFNAGC
jgi:hypothetical protein